MEGHLDMAEGFDAASALSGAAVAAAGRTFVCRYVGAYAGDWRATSAAELADDIAHGVTPVLNYEGTGKDATSFANGVTDAKYAQARVTALGFPAAVIYFSVDEQYASDIVGYFRGVESVIGHSRTGVYGGWDTVTTLHNAGLCAFFWMTYAWQFGRAVPSFVHIYQYRNGQNVNGMSVDFDRSLQANFGQISSGTPTDVNVHPFDPNTDTSEEEDMSYSITPLTDGGIYLVSLITGGRVHITSPYHVTLLQRVKKNNSDDVMLSAEVDICRGYLTAVNPPANTTVDVAGLAAALGQIQQTQDAATIQAAVNAAISQFVQKLAA